jgi:hypothetical protein
VAVKNPFGADLLVNDKVDYSITSNCWAASVYNQNPDTTIISKWRTRNRIHSFIHSFALGRIFYFAGTPGYSQSPDPIIVENSLILFDAGLFWAATGCTMPIITTQPQSQTIQSGQTANLSVIASGSPPLSYQWYQGSSGDTSNPIGGATFSSYTTPTLTETTSYWVRVTDSCGYVNSNTATITVIPAVPPSPPTNILASDGTYVDKVQVTWSASLGATSYQVYRSKSSDAGATKTLLGTTIETLFNDTTAVPMKTYFYWVKASNASGTRKFSAPDKGYCSDGSPLVPTNVSASDGIYVDKVEVTWTASLRAESYEVYRAGSNDPGATKKLLGTTTETFFNDTTAGSMKKYFYWVKASNTVGTSKFSACDKGYR